MLIAAYQDVKERAVLDIVWVPAIIGVAYSVYATYPSVDVLLLKVGLVGVVCVGFIFFGAIGQADGIALLLVSADPNPASPVFPLIATAVVAVAHIGYEFVKGNARGSKLIPIEQFLKEQRWIPKAVIVDGVRKEVNTDVNFARDDVVADVKAGSSVEVAYGVPTVAYLGVGFAVYLAYLIAFNLPLFTSLP